MCYVHNSVQGMFTDVCWMIVIFVRIGAVKDVLRGVNNFIAILSTFISDLGETPCKGSAHNTSEHL